MHNGCNDAANKTEDPPGTFRDSNGKLRNSDGTFANDPSAVKKPKTGEEYQRNMSERQKALLRDADDPMQIYLMKPVNLLKVVLFLVVQRTKLKLLVL